MEGPIVHTVMSPDGTRRVDIFKRRNGTFGFEESRWHPEYTCWHPTGQPESDSFTDTLECALREARGRLDWLEKSTSGFASDES